MPTVSHSFAAVSTVRARTCTTPELLRDAARAHPSRTAYVHGEERITYAELDRAVDALAWVLVDRGVRHGDVVTLLLPSSIRFAIAYLGAMRAGAITSAINLRLGARERDSILERTDPRVVIDGTWDRDATPSGTSSTTGLPEVAMDDPACIVWTSGTTGAPKGAVYDHERLASISRNIGVLTEPGDRRLSVLPFPHLGYMTRLWDELANATTIVLAGEPWSAAETLRLVRDESVTVMTGVPTQWALLLDHPDCAATDFSGVRLAGIGGAAIAPELVHRMRDRLGCPVVNRYTSTEAGLTTGTSPDDPPDVVASTVGRPAPEVELRLVAPDGRTVAAGEVGEVMVRAPSTMREYWRDPDATAAAFDSEGFLRTGDLGRVDDGGNLRLVGRTKEMYVRGGYNVYPVEVEAVLSDHDAVASVAVVGAPDPMLGEIGVAFVVPAVESDRASLAREPLRAWVAARLADYKAPDRVVVVDDLPLTSMLKVDKRTLIARASKED